jgi:hypothetical protein
MMLAMYNEERKDFESNYDCVVIGGGNKTKIKNGHGEANWGMHQCILALY